MNRDEGSPTGRLIAQFQAGLSERLAVIEAAWLAMIEGDAAGPERERLLRLVHQLAGSAGSFGFAHLSSAAGQLEEVLSTDLHSAWPEGLVRLRQAFREADHDRLPPAETYGEISAPLPRVSILASDAQVIESISQQLKALGFDAQGQIDPAQAILAAATFQPQILMVDLDESGQDPAHGEAISAIRRQLVDKPVLIFFSRRADVATRRLAVEAGAQAFFVKPLNITAMSVTLEQLFRGSQLQRNRVLLLEDDPDQAMFYAELMNESGLDVHVVQHPDDFLRHVQTQRPDLIVLDLELPGASGIELTSLIRQHETLFDLPILFLTATTSVAKHRDALTAGADGVFVKGDDPNFMLGVIHGRINRYRRIRHALSRDPLTGLLNRGALMERVEHELLRAQRTGDPFCMGLVDIDHFKLLNDLHGHPIGDAVIRHIATEMRGRLRVVDLLGRLGGDEFMLLMPSTALTDGARVMEELRERVSSHPLHVEGRVLSLTISAGLLEGSVNLNDSIRVVLSRMIADTDRLLYESKRAGRNRVSSSTATPVPSGALRA